MCKRHEIGNGPKWGRSAGKSRANSVALDATETDCDFGQRYARRPRQELEQRESFRNRVPNHLRSISKALAAPKIEIGRKFLHRIATQLQTPGDRTCAVHTWGLQWERVHVRLPKFLFTDRIMKIEWNKDLIAAWDNLRLKRPREERARRADLR